MNFHAKSGVCSSNNGWCPIFLYFCTFFCCFFLFLFFASFCTFCIFVYFYVSVLYFCTFTVLYFHSFVLLYFCTLSFGWTVYINFHAKFGVYRSKIDYLWVLFVLMYFLYFCIFIIRFAPANNWTKQFGLYNLLKIDICIYIVVFGELHFTKMSWNAA